MTFTLRIYFTGLCGFVPNKPLGNLADPPSKMKVVLVDARHSFRKGADGAILRPHLASVMVPVKNLGEKSPVSGSAELLWYLDTEALDIVTEPPLSTLKIIQDGSRDDFKHVANFNKFMPTEFRAVHPSYLSPEPPPQVVAHVNINGGTLKAVDVNTSEEWDIHNEDICADPANPYVENLTNRVLLELADVSSAKLIATNFENKTKIRALDLFPFGKEKIIEVTIANLCDGESLLKFPEAAPQERREDLDFKWYYELCKSYSALKDKVNHAKKKELPIPKPSTGGGRPIQCMLASFKDSAF